MSPSPPAPPRRVLIVEDDADVREVLGELIAGFGHDPIAAASGDEAVKRANEAPVAVAFVDLGLPEVDGCEVARRLRACLGGSEMHLVALTGYSDPDTRRSAVAAGFDAFLVKPADPAAIERLISSPRTP